MKKNATNGNKPATQHDVEMLGGHLSSRIDEVEGRLGGVEDRLGGVENRLDSVEGELKTHRKILESILNVVQTIEARSQETKDHPLILKNHEKRISDTEVQIRMMRR